MNDQDVHIIQRQVVEVVLPHAGRAFEWEAHQRQRFTTLIYQELEKCLDKFNRPNQHIVIDRLFIDLGVFSESGFLSEVPDRLQHNFAEAFSQQLALATRYDGVDLDSIWLGEGQSVESKIFSQADSELSVFCFFLDHGYLPWRALHPPQWTADWLRGFADPEIRRCREFLFSREEKRLYRLVTECSDEFLAAFIHRLNKWDSPLRDWHWLLGLLDRLWQTSVTGWRTKTADGVNQAGTANANPVDEISVPVIRARFWLASFRRAHHGESLPHLKQIFEKTQWEWLRHRIREIGAETGQTTGTKGVPHHWRKEFQELVAPANGVRFHQSSKSPHNDGEKEAGPAVDFVFGTSDDAFGATHLFDVKTAESVEDAGKDSTHETDGLYVEDAGLIILHPFLPQLFGKCGWLNEQKQFRDAAAGTLAIHALHYLATGDPEPAEYRLVFPKILTGLLPEALLQPVEPLSESQKNACEALLRDVIEHWKAIGATSPAGLRETFLQRQGKLIHIYSGWQIAIEHRTVDILLGRLPWGISLVRLPWMGEMLTAQWQ